MFPVLVRQVVGALAQNFLQIACCILWFVVLGRVLHSQIGPPRKAQPPHIGIDILVRPIAESITCRIDVWPLRLYGFYFAGILSKAFQARNQGHARSRRLARHVNSISSLAQKVQNRQGAHNSQRKRLVGCQGIIDGDRNHVFGNFVRRCFEQSHGLFRQSGIAMHPDNVSASVKLDQHGNIGSKGFPVNRVEIHLVTTRSFQKGEVFQFFGRQER